MFEVSVEDWLADHEDPDDDTCDRCLGDYGEPVEDIDGLPFRLCEDCQKDIN